MNMQCKTNSKYDTSNDNYDTSYDNYDTSNSCVACDHIAWAYNTYSDHIDLFINMIIFSLRNFCMYMCSA